MKLTKEEKLSVIKEVITQIIDQEEDFICIAIAHILDRDYSEDYVHVNIFDYFPELLKYKPEDSQPDESWWVIGDVSSRVKCLNKLIEEYR